MYEKRTPEDEKSTPPLVLTSTATAPSDSEAPCLAADGMAGETQVTRRPSSPTGVAGTMVPLEVGAAPWPAPPKRHTTAGSDAFASGASTAARRLEPESSTSRPPRAGPVGGSTAVTTGAAANVKASGAASPEGRIGPRAVAVRMATSTARGMCWARCDGNAAVAGGLWHWTAFLESRTAGTSARPPKTHRSPGDATKPEPTMVTGCLRLQGRPRAPAGAAAALVPARSIDCWARSPPNRSLTAAPRTARCARGAPGTAQARLRPRPPWL